MDENADGNYDQQEIGLANIVVELHVGACARIDSQPSTLAVTGPDGVYSFNPSAANQIDVETPFCLRVDERTLPAHLILSTAHVALTTAPESSSAKRANNPTYNFGYAPLFAHNQLVVGLHSCHDTAWLTSTAAQQNANAIATSVGRDNGCTFSLHVPPTRQEALHTQLKGHPNVAFVERDVRVRGQFTPNDPDYNNPALVFAPQQINAETAWDASVGDPDLIIAILDTGVDFAHEEFTGRLLNGYDYVNGDSDPADDNGHGTHVAGIAGAGINNGVGMAGIAGESKLLPMKVLNENNLGWWSDVAQAMTDAVDEGAAIINLSISSAYGSTALENALQYALDHDVLVVAAAGNENVDTPRFPAAYAYDNLLGVGGTQYNGERWALSNSGPNVDLLAPAQFIRSTIWQTGNSNAYGFMTGTSMATPHVAGVAALLLSVDPTLAPQAVIEILTDTATDLGDPGVDVWHGHGRIDAGAAMQALLDILAPPVLPGNCNGDAGINAGDISALTLEIFDGDGDLPEDAHGGAFPGSGPGCNANGDAHINAGDISCTTLMIFNGPDACTPIIAANRDSAVDSTPTLAMPDVITAAVGAQIDVPIRLAIGDRAAGDAAINALVFSLDIDESQLGFDPSDHNGDGLPDAVRIDAPATFSARVTYNPTKRDGELDIVLFNLTPDAAIGEEPLLTLAFSAKSAERAGGENQHNAAHNAALNAALKVVTDPAPSAGDRDGRAHSVRSGAPLQLIVWPAVESRRIFLPVVGSG